MTSRRSKAEAIRRHARQRFALRFDLTEADVAECARMIRDGQSTLVEKQSNTRTVHRVTYQDQTIDCVYDKLRGQVVTALYPSGEEPE